MLWAVAGPQGTGMLRGEELCSSSRTCGMIRETLTRDTRPCLGTLGRAAPVDVGGKMHGTSSW